MLPFYKKGLILLGVLLHVIGLWGCDVCGSAMTGSGVNLLNAHYYSYAGLSWQHSYTGSENNTLEDLSHQLDANVHYYFNNRISLQINIPYIVNQRRTRDEFVSRNGLGDIRFISRFAVINGADISTDFKTSLHIAGIVSAPTGTYDARIYQYDLPEHFNVGNGAWAYGAELLSVWNYNNIGWSIGGTALRFADNEVGYRYGSQIIARSGMFYSIPTQSSWSYVTQFAIQYEYQESDRYQTGVINKDTGGEAIVLFPGLSIQYDR